MRIVFCGTPDFAVPCLEKLIEAGHDVCAVFTQPDKAKGRSKELVGTPVKECALMHAIDVEQPEKLKENGVYEMLQSMNPDVIVVAAFGQIVPKSILELPKYGCINVHASLLPAYRGAAPIQWSILDGCKETGTTIMQMGPGLDTGDIITQEKMPILEDDTADSLFEKLSHQGAELLIKTLENIDKAVRTPQPEKSTTPYARMITKADGKIDWSKDTEQIDCLIRGMNSWPSAFTSYNGKTLKIWKAQKTAADDIDTAGSEAAKCGEIIFVDKKTCLVKTGSGVLSLREVQLEGKKRMGIEDFLRGVRISKGDMLL